MVNCVTPTGSEAIPVDKGEGHVFVHRPIPVGGVN